MPCCAQKSNKKFISSNSFDSLRGAYAPTSSIIVWYTIQLALQKSLSLVVQLYKLKQSLLVNAIQIWKTIFQTSKSLNNNKQWNWNWGGCCTANRNITARDEARLMHSPCRSIKSLSLFVSLRLHISPIRCCHARSPLSHIRSWKLGELFMLLCEQ